MITVRRIPNLLKNDGRTSTEVPYVPGATIAQYAAVADISLAGNRVILSGIKNPKLEDAPRDGSEIIVTPEISAPVGVAIAAAFSAAGAWVAAHTVSAIILAVTIGYSIYQATQKPKMPSYGSVPMGSFDDASPTYAWDGIRTLQGEVNVPVAIGYGEHRAGGNIINQFVRSDGQKQYLYLLLAFGEGEIEAIENIEINDNPIGNFASVEVVKRFGTNDQTPIENFEELHQVNEVNAEITKDSPYTYTTIEEIDAFEVSIRFPLGIYYIASPQAQQTDKIPEGSGGFFGDLIPAINAVIAQQNSGADSGGIRSSTVVYRIDYRVFGEVDWIDLGSFEATEKSRTVVNRVIRKEGLTRDRYDIRLTRVTTDSTFDDVSDMYLDQVDEIVTEDLAYPNTALLAIKALANEQLSGSVPKITAECKWKKVSVPDVRNGSNPVGWADYYWDPAAEEYRLFSDDTPLTWDGTTYVDAWSANPVWCFKDLLLNGLYGLGQKIDATLISDAKYLEMARYAQERVQVTAADGSTSWEHRFRMDIVIDGLSDALDLLVQMSAVFRGMPFYGRGFVDLHIDKPEDPVQLFGMGNIVENSFQQRWAPKREKFNVIECSYMNKDRAYRQEIVTVADEAALEAGEERRVKQLRLFTTHTSIAIRESKYALNIARLVDRNLTFKAGIDAITCRVGEIIRFSHDVPQYGFSGRVQDGSTTTLVKLDRSVTLEPFKTYEVEVRFKSTGLVEKRSVTNVPGAFVQLAVSPAFSEAPSAYDVYAFGEVGIVTKPYRVIGITRESNQEVMIQALEYNENVYSDDGVTLPVTNYSALDLSIPNVTDLALTERLVKLGDGTIENVLDVWWKNPSLANFYVKQYTRANVYLSDNEGVSWRFVGSTTGEAMAIQGGIEDGVMYRVAVAGVNELGAQESIDDAPQASITIVGKSAKPSDITTLLAVQSRDRVRLAWTAAMDIDLSGYEIRKGDSWEAGQVVVSNLKSTNYIDIDVSEGETNYFIKAIDTSENYSQNATMATVLVNQLPFSNTVQSYAEEPAWSGTKVNLTDIGDELELDAGEDVGTYTGPVRDLGFVAPFRILMDALAVGSTGQTWQSFSGLAWSDLSPSQRWGGLVISGALSFEIKISEDNVTWSDWMSFIPGEYTCRYFQIRMTVTRPSPGTGIKVARLHYVADLPEITETGTDTVSVAGDGVDITFQKTFHQEPVAGWNILSGTGIYVKITAKDTTGMNIKIYDVTNTAVTGDVEYTLNGV